MLDSIAIIGSLDADRDYQPQLDDVPSAVRARREIGERLAAEGLGLTVYSSSPRFVEAAVVEGYAASPAARPHSIRLMAPMRSSHKQFAAMTDHPRLFQVVNDPATDWEVSFYRSLASVAGVLLIGGGRSTYIAGLIALSLRTPVVALAKFGGAAHLVWESFGRIKNDVTEEELQIMADNWSGRSAASLVTSLKDQARREAEREQSGQDSSRRATVSLLVSGLLFLLGVALIPLLFAIRPSAPWNVAVLISASVLVAPMGSVIRNVLGQGRHWVRTAVLGMVAGASPACCSSLPRWRRPRTRCRGPALAPCCCSSYRSVSWRG